LNGPPADVANTPPPDAPPRQAKRYRPESNALRRSIRYLVSDGFSYGIRMEGFSASANAVLKAANGTFYQRDSSPYSRYWRVPIRHFGYEGENLAQRFLQALGCRAKPTDLIAALQRAPIDRGAFTDEMMVTIKPLHPEGLAISTNHYHEGVVAISKMMGAKWMPHEKAWLLVGDDKHQAPTISSMMFNLQQELLLADDQFEITPQFKLEQQAGGDRDVVLTPFVGMLPTPIVANQDEDGRFLRKAVKQLARTKLTIADIEAGIARIDQTRTDGSRALPHQRESPTAHREAETAKAHRG